MALFGVLKLKKERKRLAEHVNLGCCETHVPKTRRDNAFSLMHEKLGVQLLKLLTRRSSFPISLLEFIPS